MTLHRHLGFSMLFRDTKTQYSEAEHLLYKAVYINEPKTGSRMYHFTFALSEASYMVVRLALASRQSEIRIET